MSTRSFRSLANATITEIAYRYWYPPAPYPSIRPSPLPHPDLQSAARPHHNVSVGVGPAGTRHLNG